MKQSGHLYPSEETGTGVVGYFWYFNFLCEFCFLYCDDVWLRAVYEVFSSLILFLMPFMLI